MRATDILLRPYRKLRLTVKDVNKGFYKGTRTGSMGRHTKKGGYVIEFEKVRTFVVPSLVDFNVSLPFSVFRPQRSSLTITAHPLHHKTRARDVWRVPPERRSAQGPAESVAIPGAVEGRERSRLRVVRKKE